MNKYYIGCIIVSLVIISIGFAFCVTVNNTKNEETQKHVNFETKLKDNGLRIVEAQIKSPAVIIWLTDENEWMQHAKEAGVIYEENVNAWGVIASYYAFNKEMTIAWGYSLVQ